MALTWYGGSPADVLTAVVTTDQNEVAIRPSTNILTAWTARSGGTRITDLRTSDGITTTQTVATDAVGAYWFAANNYSATLWLDDGTRRWRCDPADLATRTGGVATVAGRTPDDTGNVPLRLEDIAPNAFPASTPDNPTAAQLLDVLDVYDTSAADQAAAEVFGNMITDYFQQYDSTQGGSPDDSAPPGAMYVDVGSSTPTPPPPSTDPVATVRLKNASTTAGTTHTLAVGSGGSQPVSGGGDVYAWVMTGLSTGTLAAPVSPPASLAWTGITWDNTPYATLTNPNSTGGGKLAVVLWRGRVTGSPSGSLTVNMGTGNTASKVNAVVTQITHCTTAPSNGGSTTATDEVITLPNSAMSNGTPNAARAQLSCVVLQQSSPDALNPGTVVGNDAGWTDLLDASDTVANQQGQATPAPSCLLAVAFRKSATSNPSWIGHNDAGGTYFKAMAVVELALT